MLRHKTSLNKFKKIEIIPTVFSDHNGIILEINHKKKIENTERHGGWITCYETVSALTMISRKKGKDTSKQMKIRTQQQNLWDTAKAVLTGKSIAL